MTTTTPPSTPSFKDIAQLIAPLLRSSKPTAEALSESATQSAALLRDPAAHAALRTLTELSELRARFLASEGVISAIAALQKTMSLQIDGPRNAEIVRKAASALIRLDADLRRHLARAGSPTPDASISTAGSSSASALPTPLAPIPTYRDAAQLLRASTGAPVASPCSASPIAAPLRTPAAPRGPHHSPPVIIRAAGAAPVSCPA